MRPFDFDRKNRAGVRGMRESLMGIVCKGITEEERRIMRQVAKKIAHNISMELGAEIQSKGKKEKEDLDDKKQ